MPLLPSALLGLAVLGAAPSARSDTEVFLFSDAQAQLAPVSAGLGFQMAGDAQEDTFLAGVEVQLGTCVTSCPVPRYPAAQGFTYEYLGASARFGWRWRLGGGGPLSLHAVGLLGVHSRDTVAFELDAGRQLAERQQGPALGLGGGLRYELPPFLFVGAEARLRGLLGTRITYSAVPGVDPVTRDIAAFSPSVLLAFGARL